MPVLSLSLSLFLRERGRRGRSPALLHSIYVCVCVCMYFLRLLLAYSISFKFTKLCTYIRAHTYILATCWHMCVCVCVGAHNVSTYAHIFILLGVATLPHKVPHTHRTHTRTHTYTPAHKRIYLRQITSKKVPGEKTVAFSFCRPRLGGGAGVQGCRLQTEIELRSCWSPRPSNPTSPAVSVCVSPKCSTNKSTHWRKFCGTCTFLLPLLFLCRNE